MSNTPTFTPGQNIHNKPIYVNHADLDNATPDSICKKICPLCATGWLLVKRSFTSPHLILADDNCTFCGQHFIYNDFEWMNALEGL